MGSERTDGSPSQNERHEDGVAHILPPTHAVMAEHAAENQLDVQNENGEQGQSTQARTARVSFNVRLLLDPHTAGEERNRDSDAEKRLRHSRVRGRNHRWLKIQ